MAQDQSEKIDDYCNDMYGHTNWGYLDTYSKEELDAKDHDIEDNIVYWHEEVEDDEECEEQNWRGFSNRNAFYGLDGVFCMLITHKFFLYILCVTG